MNITSLLNDVNEPDRPALIFSKPSPHQLSFRELRGLSSNLAVGLRELGIQPGDRVILMAPISVDLFVLMIALFRSGATAVLPDPGLKRGLFEKSIRKIEAKALFSSQKAMWIKLLSPALRSIPIQLSINGRNSIRQLANSARPFMEIASVSQDQPALITFTGGSTDTDGPRGVLRSYGLLLAQHEIIGNLFQNKSTDVDMPAFPILTLHNLGNGIPSVIPDYPFRRPESVEPEKILRQIKDHRVTTASGSPAYWWQITEYCIVHDQLIPLERIITGGAPVTPALIKRLAQTAPQAEVFCAYGSTEADPVSLITGNEVLAQTDRKVARGGGIPLGHPISEINVQIRARDDQPLSNGEIGEIWVSGRHVARGYFADPKADEISKRMDSTNRLWHRMGDMGYMDEQGCLWLAGRIHSVIVRFEKDYHPLLLEGAIELFGFIRRAAVIGIPDKLIGERISLVVEFARHAPRPHGWREMLHSRCTEINWPVDEIRTIRKMPTDRRHNSRIDYTRLKSLFR